MVLFLQCFGILSINCTVFYLYMENSYLMRTYNKLSKILKQKNNFLLNYYNLIYKKTQNSYPEVLLFDDSIKERAIKETERLHNLSIEKIKLNNKLKTLDFINYFEIYLLLNKTDRDKLIQVKEFSDLKLITQQSILEITKRINYLSAA